MNKQEFLINLRKGLYGLPQEDIEDRLEFYSEMIEDGMEEGLSENDAVNKIGTVDSIISQIFADTPLAKLVKEKIKPKQKLKTWEIILLFLGSPIWLPLIISAFAIILSLYVSLWSVIISVWAIEVSLWGCALGGVISGIVLAFSGNMLSGTAIIGVSLVCAGLSVFMLYGCKSATKGIILLTKKLPTWLKSCFIKKEEA